jgi:hypothetical protein
VYSDISLAEEAALPLPQGYSRHTGPTGAFVYLDAGGARHEEHPIIKAARKEAAAGGALPGGWREHSAALADHTAEAYYSNKALGVSMWDHPALRGAVERLVGEEGERRAEREMRAAQGGGVTVTAAPAAPGPASSAPGPASSAQVPASSAQVPASSAQVPASSAAPTSVLTPSKLPIAQQMAQRAQRLAAQSLSASAATASYPLPPNSGPYGPSSGPYSPPPLPGTVAEASRRLASLAASCAHVNLMNHHRLLAHRHRCGQYFPGLAPPEPLTFDVPPGDALARLVGRLQRAPGLVARALRRLEAQGRDAEGAMLGHFATHVLLNPVSTDLSRTEALLMELIGLVGGPGRPNDDDDVLRDGEGSFPAADLFLSSSSSSSSGAWDPSLTPLCANGAGTALTHLLLLVSLRSDSLSYFRSVLKPKLSPPTLEPDRHDRGPTVASATKRRLKNDEPILRMCERLLDALLSKEALAKIPQPAVEVYWALCERYGGKAGGV